MDSQQKKLIKACKTWDEIYPHLKNIEFHGLKSRDIQVLSRSIKKCVEQPQQKIAYLSNYTIDLLPGYVRTYAAINNLKTTHYIGEFAQYYQEVLTPDSDLKQFNPDTIFLTLSIRSLSPDIFFDFLDLSDQRKDEEKNKVLEHINTWIALAKQQTNAILLISNFVKPLFNQAGIADAHTNYSESEWYQTLNLALLKQFKGDPRVYLYDLDHVQSRFGKNNTLNPKMVYLAKMEQDESSFSGMAMEIFRYIHANKGHTKKCVVLDLDNTLWGGIVGEDGVNGVLIEKGHPQGEIYYEFQKLFKSLKQRGIALAIASKNNLEDAREVFDKRDMPLKWDDFSAYQINWNPKNQGLLAIADDLNIGINSLVFVDDNPVERGLIKEMLPEVEVIELPLDPSEYIRTLRQSYFFEKLLITEEDKNKQQQFAQNTQRNQLKQGITDISSYLEKLNTQVTLLTPNESHLARIHQLFTKTNQFNLTTKRLSMADIENIIADKNWEIKLVSVKDNFGDLGIVGLYVINTNGGIACIDSFILSCRAMGRGIETVMINNIKNECFEKKDIQSIESSYTPTLKNKPTLEFYETQGFNLAQETESKSKIYNLNRDQSNLIDTHGITITQA